VSATPIQQEPHRFVEVAGADDDVVAEGAVEDPRLVPAGQQTAERVASPSSVQSPSGDRTASDWGSTSR
jgi:hypothetical protein